MTAQDFRSWNGEPGLRYELVDGVPVAMSLPSIAHGILVANLTRALTDALEPPFYLASEAAVSLARDDAYYQADLLVSCTPMQAGDVEARDPVLIVEVLSRSTAAHDRGTKLADYRELSSVDEILLVSSDERRVESWKRDGDRWVVSTVIGAGTCEVRGATLELDALYRGVASEER